MTARSTRNRLWPKSLPKRARSLLSASLLASTILLDQTLAVVGPKIITLSEVRGEIVVSAILQGKQAPTDPAMISAQEQRKALQTLVRRAVVGNYLDSIGLVSDVPAKRVDRLLGTIRPHLDKTFLSEKTLRPILVGRIRGQLFVEEHLPFRVNVTEQEVRKYYEMEKDRKFLGEPFSKVAPIVRADLQRERMKKEAEKWLETEMNRTKVIFLDP